MQIRRGDIWYVNSNDSIGSEQRAGRPSIVVSNDLNNAHSTTIEVVYLTTAPKRDLPTHVLIQSVGRESIALCEQISTVSIERLGNYRGRVTDEEMVEVEKAMLISLGLCGRDAASAENLLIPDPLVRIAAAEARYEVLQKMYRELLDRLVKVG